MDGSWSCLIDSLGKTLYLYILLRTISLFDNGISYLVRHSLFGNAIPYLVTAFLIWSVLYDVPIPTQILFKIAKRIDNYCLIDIRKGWLIELTYRLNMCNETCLILRPYLYGSYQTVHISAIFETHCSVTYVVELYLYTSLYTHDVTNAKARTKRGESRSRGNHIDARKKIYYDVSTSGQKSQLVPRIFWTSLAFENHAFLITIHASRLEE